MALDLLTSLDLAAVESPAESMDEDDTWSFNWSGSIRAWAEVSSISTKFLESSVGTLPGQGRLALSSSGPSSQGNSSMGKYSCSICNGMVAVASAAKLADSIQVEDKDFEANFDGQ